MTTNTLGEFSDGEDDFVFEVDENLWANSENDDDLIRNIDENEVLAANDDDDDLIRSIDEEEVLAQFSQTGWGEKRKSDEQDVEQGQHYYDIETVKKHHSKKFNMTATDHVVRFNNVLAEVDLFPTCSIRKRIRITLDLYRARTITGLIL